jgi:RimJ/RimL family protein N-acetyltransferase
MIETERLILRKVDPERDFEPLAQAMADENTVKYLGTRPLSRHEAWRSMAAVIGHWEIRGFGFFSLESKETGEWIGRVGPWYPEGWPDREVGWTIAPQHLRKGYGAEAARASIAYAFDTLRWQRLIHIIMEGNAASVALARSVGSRFIREQQGLPGIADEKVLIFGQDRPGS